MVDVDPVQVDAEVFQTGALDGEVLFDGGNPGVADQQSTHQHSAPLGVRLPK